MIKVNINNGYANGAVRIEAEINKKRYIVINVEETLKKAIERGDYETSKQGREVIPRLEIVEHLIPMDMKCDLAEALTARECRLREITIDKRKKNGDLNYTEQAQDIFNYFLDLVDNTLNI